MTLLAGANSILLDASGKPTTCFETCCDGDQDRRRARNCITGVLSNWHKPADFPIPYTFRKDNIVYRIDESSPIVSTGTIVTGETPVANCTVASACHPKGNVMGWTVSVFGVTFPTVCTPLQLYQVQPGGAIEPTGLFGGSTRSDGGTYQQTWTFDGEGLPICSFVHSAPSFGIPIGALVPGVRVWEDLICSFPPQPVGATNVQVGIQGGVFANSIFAFNVFSGINRIFSAEGVNPQPGEPFTLQNQLPQPVGTYTYLGPGGGTIRVVATGGTVLFTPHFEPA